MYCCKECGSTNVESKAYIDPNTNKIIDGFSPSSKHNNWCRDCELVVALVHKEVSNGS